MQILHARSRWQTILLKLRCWKIKFQWLKNLSGVFLYRTENGRGTGNGMHNVTIATTSQNGKTRSHFIHFEKFSMFVIVIDWGNRFSSHSFSSLDTHQLIIQLVSILKPAECQVRRLVANNEFLLKNQNHDSCVSIVAAAESALSTFSLIIPLENLNKKGGCASNEF